MPDRYYRDYLRSVIRTVPDWPEQGVMFRDVTTLFKDKKAFRYLIDAFVHRYHDHDIDAVAGVDARGFILGAPIAYELNTSFIPVRKKGKLPYDTVEESYELEYGTATVELHTDAFNPGDKVLLIDDLIATGGTMIAAANLIKRLGAEVVEAAAIIDLPDLGGSEKLKAQGIEVYSICEFEGE
jgi:adenine phosphoribosyltransferase